jgi:hypothetical protein
MTDLYLAAPYLSLCRLVHGVLLEGLGHREVVDWTGVAAVHPSVNGILEVLAEVLQVALRDEPLLHAPHAGHSLHIVVHQHCRKDERRGSCLLFGLHIHLKLLSRTLSSLFSCHVMLCSLNSHFLY